MDKVVPIEVSARHIHLAKEDAEALFGQGYELRKQKEITQPGLFASEETVTIETSSGRKIENVRVIGPYKQITYAELSQTDFYTLKQEAPTMHERELGEIEGTSIIVSGPHGSFTKPVGFIIKRHIHCNSQSAEELGLKDNTSVSINISGERSVTFHNVMVLVEENAVLRMYVDTDEANAAGIKQQGEGAIVLEG